jgi:type IV pilus assembly protein PilB
MPAYDDKSLYEALKELKVIDPKVLYQKFEESRTSKIAFPEILLREDLISDKDLGAVIADLFNLPLIVLSSVSIPEEVLNLIPEESARNYKAVVFKKDAKSVSMATSKPTDQTMKDFLAKKTGLEVSFYYATERDIEDTLAKYTKDITKAFQKVIEANIAKIKGSQKPEVPVAQIVDTIISYAYDNKASDVHVEPLEGNSIVRYRSDGILHDVVYIPKDLHEQIVNRVKVMAKLRTDEHSSAQDGKILFKLPQENLDIRVSVVPVVNGEKIALRLLSERSRQFGLSDLGLSPDNLKKIEYAYKNPNGMILATGPTGCGKTTTLYSILKILNKKGVNIMTVEDPVEYEIERVNQIQVNPATNLTFAEGLKSIVRQDPDIILVGEIRDPETAGIAVNSALTGHLVLSSVHTNDAATTFVRLLDFGVEPFVVASTIRVVIAQRLVRKICSSCKVSTPVDLASIKKSFTNPVIDKYFTAGQEAIIYKGKGCPVCLNSGYAGRLGIFEVLVVDEEIRQAVIARKDAATISQIAVKNGMKTMLEDGIEKAKAGITTLEEVDKVTRE